MLKETADAWSTISPRSMLLTAAVDVRSAHIDGCLYHGQAGLDFAERLASAGGRIVVPATLNVGSLDLLHPGLFRGDEETARLANGSATGGCGCTSTTFRR
jgi:predicted aconitase